MNQPWDISIAQGENGPVRLSGKATGEPSGGGGGPVIIGPFAFAYNTPGVADGLLLGAAGDVPAGWTIIRTWLAVTETFLATGALTIDIALTLDSDPGDDVWNVASYTGTSSIAAQGSADIEVEAQSTADRFLYTAKPRTSGRLILYLTATTPTAGTGRVYALIAPPAA